MTTDIPESLKTFASLVKLVNDREDKKLPPLELPYPLTGAGIEILGEMNSSEKASVALIDRYREKQQELLAVAWGSQPPPFRRGNK